MASKKNEMELSFEEAANELERIVTKLESSEVSLEQAIELYQKGLKLSKLCADKLKHVEQQIEMLVDGDIGVTRKPFPSQLEDQVKPFE
jgi:exodeoxyribonuclease VII small subunit